MTSKYDQLPAEVVNLGLENTPRRRSFAPLIFLEEYGNKTFTHPFAFSLRVPVTSVCYLPP